MKIKINLKTKIQNLLGLNKLELNLRDIKAISIISQLNANENLRNDWILSCFQSVNGGIKSTKIENLKRYLNIIRPVKWGGDYDESAVKMMADMLWQSQIRQTTQSLSR